jgi:serralysin
MAIQQTASVSSTGDNSIDSLLSGLRWQGSSVSYSFSESGSTFLINYSDEQEPWTGYEPTTSAQRQGIRQALLLWSQVANITITEVSEPTSSGVIRFGQSSAPNTAWAYYPNNTEPGGDVWFGFNYNYDNPHWETYADYAFHTMVHEIGHALGLKHPGQYSSSDEAPYAAIAIDALQYSVMSYIAYPGAGLGVYVSADSYPQTPMINDIAAIQYMYGANYNYNSGDTVYSFSPTDTKIFRTLWDGGGVDTYDASAYTAGVTLQLAPGDWSTLATGQLANLGNGVVAPGSVANALLYQSDTRSLIENAIGGSGDDILRGNAGNNQLTGGAGNDQLWGGTGGADTLIGGNGSNGYWWDAGSSNTDVIGVSGTDCVYFTTFTFDQRTGGYTADGDLWFSRSGVSTRVSILGWQNQTTSVRTQSFVFNENGTYKAFAWNAGAAVEVNLYDGTYSAAGVRQLECVDSSNAILRGSAANEIITGGAGHDQLWGGSGGSDTLAGGAGSNTYWWDVDNGNDIVVSASGTDAMCFSGFSFAQRIGGIGGTGDLVFSRTGGTSQVNIQGWQNQNTAGRMQSFVFNENGTYTAFAWNNGAAVEVNLYDAAYRAVAVNSLECVDASDATLRGSAISDVIRGGAGNDQIWGGSGGDDTLYGGLGSDVYWWDGEGGQVVIGYEADNANDTIRLSSLNRANLTVSLSGDNLLIATGAASLTIENWNQGKLDRILFANGAEATLTSLLAPVAGMGDISVF